MFILLAYNQSAVISAGNLNLDFLLVNFPKIDN